MLCVIQLLQPSELKGALATVKGLAEEAACEGMAAAREGNTRLRVWSRQASANRSADGLVPERRIPTCELRRSKAFGLTATLQESALCGRISGH